MRTLALLLVLAAAPSAQALAAPVSPALDPVGPVHPYHTWETLTLELRELVSEHPGIARLHSAGQSTLGFDLWLVEIGDFANQSRVPFEAREVVWLDGGTHANEQLGMMLAYLWAKFLLEEYETNATAKWIVENRHTWILPMLNPDGNHLDSRTNGRGVNINRNYPVGWGRVDENPAGNNPGPYAMSEPETRAVVGWLHQVKPDYFNSFHTGVDMMLFPTGYADMPAPDDAMYKRICAEIGETDPAFCGPVYSTIYPASGIAIDTAYEDVGAVAWTYEVSPEGGLYASLDDPRIRLDRYWKGVEHAFLNVEKYGAHLRLVSLDVLGGNVARLVVENDGYSDLAEAVVVLAAPGGDASEARLGGLASGARATIEVPVAVRGDAAGALDVGFRYVKRAMAAPEANDLVRLPASVAGGALAVAPLEDVAVTVAPPESLALPAPAASLAALLLAAVAGLRRRSTR